MKNMEGKKRMSVFNYLVEKLRSGLITFINMVTLANRDFPYHDYETYATAAVPAVHVVGRTNILTTGDQHKLFVSKSTLIMATGNATIRFNNTNNVLIGIVANTWYEFKSNIKVIYIVTLADTSNIYIYCEGVLPEEQRSPL